MGYRIPVRPERFLYGTRNLRTGEMSALQNSRMIDDGISFDGLRSRMDMQYHLEMLEHIKRGQRSGRVPNPFRLWVLNPREYFGTGHRGEQW